MVTIKAALTNILTTMHIIRDEETLEVAQSLDLILKMGIEVANATE